jgi:DUF2946 family protein
MRSNLPFTLRRSILTLAITQLVMCSVTPLHELGATADRGMAKVERQHAPTGAPAHDPDTCPVCQLVNAQFLRPEATHLLPASTTVQRPMGVSIELPVARAPPAAHQTRAPPLLLV